MATTILVVDDEPLYIHLLKVNLESEGYEIETAPDGEKHWRWFHATCRI